MKDYVLELTAQKEGFNAKLNAMREYLQAYILRTLHDQRLFRHSAFVGGTALRFLYDLPRFSEDLDFSLEKKLDYSFADILKNLKQELALAGYEIAVTYNEEKTVYSAMIKFKKLMFEAGISPLAGQNFSVKIEIDTNPPKGASLQTYLVNKYFPITFLSYDTASLFAGKVGALMSRKYTKGRDFFDLGWYLSRWTDISPNIGLLQNGLRQTGWKNEMPTGHTWREVLFKIVEAADWKKVEGDVKNFLENSSDLSVFTQKNILNLINRVT